MASPFYTWGAAHMWPWSSVDDLVRARARLTVHHMGTWIREHEPSPTVDEDLVAHHLRSLLAELREEAESEKGTRVAELMGLAALSYQELMLLRAKRGVRR